MFFINIYGQKNITAKYLGIENGLSNNVVTAIFRDHNGFMWFGTYDGLNRYDGYGFKVFRIVMGDSTSINSNIINKIDEDYQHNLWIGGQRHVSIFNPATAKFSTPVYILSNGENKRSLKDNVVEVKVLNKNNTPIGTEHNGLFYFENTGTGKQVSLFENGKSITSYYVSAIACDTARSMAYVFIQNYGLYLYDARTHRLAKRNNSLQNANYLGVVAADINNDGWQDLYMTNDYEEQDFLLLNNHNGTFTEVTKDALKHISKYGMGCDVADYNNDGLPDIMVPDMCQPLFGSILIFLNPIDFSFHGRNDLLT